MIKRCLFLSLVLSSLAHASSTGLEDYRNRETIRHIEGGGIGYKEGYTTLDFLSTIDVFPTGYLLLDLRGHLFNNSKFGGNGGGGVRFGKESTFMCGLNAYYDFRYDHFLFNQIGLGVDFRKSNFFLCVNGYRSLGPKIRILDTVQEEYQEGYFASEHRIINSFNHFDTQLGYLFSFKRACSIYIGGGPYILRERCKCISAFWGGMGHIQWTFKRYLAIDGFVSKDHLFGTKYQIQLTLIFPFSKEEKKAFYPVERQEIIPLHERTVWDWNY